MVASRIEQAHDHDLCDAMPASYCEVKDAMTARKRDIYFERTEPVSVMPTAIGSPSAWLAALTFWATSLGRYAGALAAELRARRAIDYLRSLDDDRLLDLGIKRRQDIEHFVRSRND